MRYDIVHNVWETMPTMIVARAASSSCKLGFWLYAFCGITTRSKFVNSIERLQIARNQKSYLWYLVPSTRIPQIFTPKW